MTTYSKTIKLAGADLQVIKENISTVTKNINILEMPTILIEIFFNNIMCFMSCIY